MDFKDKVVWITGASSGIGEHLAYGFAELGAKLILTGRNEGELRRVSKNCHQEAMVKAYPFDITHFDAIPALAERAISEFGFINLLINNAGVSQRGLALETRFEVDQRLMAINYLGPVALTKAVLPAMLRQQFGHIVVVSSVLGRISVPGRSGYCAAKHALHGFFNSLRAELHGENIKVTILCPGYVNTNLSLNALRGDGYAHARPPDDRRNSHEPALFAQLAIRAISAEKEEVYFGGGKETLAVYLQRFFPRWYRRLARRQSWR
jgi:dehydrogenase/reductase SDR family protein 7B